MIIAIVPIYDKIKPVFKIKKGLYNKRIKTDKLIFVHMSLFLWKIFDIKAKEAIITARIADGCIPIIAI